MAEQEVSPEQVEFYQWLGELGQDTPLSDLVEQPDSAEAPLFEPEELERLEELGRAYAQELFERDAIPDMPPMDMDERLLEPEPMLEFDQDLDFDLDR
jgi:hypothetical protein